MNMQQNTNVTNESDAADISEVEQVLRELQRLVNNDRVDHLLVAVSKNSFVSILADGDMTSYDHMALIGFLQTDVSLRMLNAEFKGVDGEQEQKRVEQQQRMEKKQSGSGIPEDCMNLLEAYGSLESLKSFHEQMTRKNALGHSSPFANFVPLPEQFESMNRSWQRNWCQKNWGDKRDPGHLWKMEGDEPGRCDRETYYYQYRFETAWEPPIPWLQKVSLAMPEVELMLYYFEASTGFCGETLYRAGKCMLQDEYLRENDQYRQIGERYFGLTVNEPLLQLYRRETR